MQRTVLWKCRLITAPTRERYSSMAPRVLGARRTPRPKQPPLTHFLCVPLVTAASRPQLEQSLKAFREDVSSTNDSQVHPKAIRPLGTLHCTLGVMSLDPQRLADATAFLASLSLSTLLEEASKELADRHSTTPPPLIVDIRGLVSMHEDQKTSILYAEPKDPTGRLRPFCLALQNAFKDRGFLVADDRDLKLHATIINTIYAKGRKAPSATATEGAGDRSAGHGPNANAPLKIDARDLIEKYGEHLWAENVKIESVAICQMGAEKLKNAEGQITDERYTEVASATIMPA